MAELAGLGAAGALLALAFGYLLGSIPFGLILTRLAGTADLRAIGSGNIGATNVLRTGRKDLAAATLLLDALKGSIAVWVAMRWGAGAGVLAGLGAFLGHLYPVWLRFAGGKGVATFIGVLLALWWPGLIAFAVLWLAVAYVTRYSSLAALVASALLPIGHLVLDWRAGQVTAMSLVFLIMAALLWWKHRPNIERLLAGTEGRIGQKG
ncbi:glycerol-3-phosphate 1-O-acyltransferase PlsY [Rhabdaerophilum sp. SD176]|uniref:glycerol-3-phosphate 1-O-acyltransferase PlsY n=1 Tax=Rhabdaerophilum sp. SD176 TaxID=2983548 RepID=UPI0024DFF836|nr:glycerol-3-phosphate 1-O-acyltransferase PlsY [Rhabdaerophilum sp. SD176]